MSWIQSTIHNSVSLIKAKHKTIENYGTGFYYSHDSDDTVGKSGWKKVNDIYFITAKHCLLDNESLCEELIINSNLPIDGSTKRHQFTLTQEDIIQNAFIHENDDVDIVVILIDHEHIFRKDNKSAFLSRDMLPQYNDYLKVETTSDVVTYGFPYGYYDETNLFPLCKSGIIASGWGLNFNGDPIFKIDIQLFSVSSGSPVISKPQQMVLKDSKLYFKDSPQILLLGIYTGEYTKRMTENVELVYLDGKKDFVEMNKHGSLGFGTVFYSYLIDEIIKTKRRF
jgi:V8-like Glu-specific endopeptidase